MAIREDHQDIPSYLAEHGELYFTIILPRGLRLVIHKIDIHGSVVVRAAADVHSWDFQHYSLRAYSTLRLITSSTNLPLILSLNKVSIDLFLVPDKPLQVTIRRQHHPFQFRKSIRQRAKSFSPTHEVTHVLEARLPLVIFSLDENVDQSWT